MKSFWKLVLNYFVKLGLNKASVKAKNSALKLILSGVQKGFSVSVSWCARVCV